MQVRVGEISKHHDIQSFSGSFNDFVEKNCCHSSLLPKLRGGHPLEVSRTEGFIKKQNFKLEPIGLKFCRGLGGPKMIHIVLGLYLKVMAIFKKQAEKAYQSRYNQAS